jgi:hypothetical protein
VLSIVSIVLLVVLVVVTPVVVAYVAYVVVAVGLVEVVVWQRPPPALQQNEPPRNACKGHLIVRGNIMEASECNPALEEVVSR